MLYFLLLSAFIARVGKAYVKYWRNNEYLLYVWILKQSTTVWEYRHALKLLNSGDKAEGSHWH